MIELLVVLATLALLIALALPALSRSRQAAQRNAQLQTVRQLNGALLMYCQDQREGLPFFGTPGNALAPVRIRGFEVPGPFFRVQRWLWASAVVPEYFAPRRAIEPEGQAEYLRGVLGWPESIVAGRYQLTSTAFAAPAFWRDDDTPGGQSPLNESHLRRTTLAQIRHPSAKGLLGVDLSGPRGGFPEPGADPDTVVGMGDWSARLIDWRLLDWSRAVARPWGAAGVPIESTRGGLEGVDF